VKLNNLIGGSVRKFTTLAEILLGFVVTVCAGTVYFAPIVEGNSWIYKHSYRYVGDVTDLFEYFDREMTVLKTIAKGDSLEFTMSVRDSGRTRMTMALERNLDTTYTLTGIKTRDTVIFPRDISFYLLNENYFPYSMVDTAMHRPGWTIGMYGSRVGIKDSTRMDLGGSFAYDNMMLVIQGIGMVVILNSGGLPGAWSSKVDSLVSFNGKPWQQTAPVYFVNQNTKRHLNKNNNQAFKAVAIGQGMTGITTSELLLFNLCGRRISAVHSLPAMQVYIMENLKNNSATAQKDP
jgi:hypothetical protein